MIFKESEIAGAFIIDVERFEDARGFFARTFCQHEFEEHGLEPAAVQTSIAYNHHKGTMRGMHFQRPPSAETKVVSCTQGAILDVIVDLRPESDTYLRHIAVELTAENRRSLYVPKRFAHGYQTLTDEAQVSYVMSEFYAPETSGGLPYDDPKLGITWPLEVSEISDRDRQWAPLEKCEVELRDSMQS